MTETEFAKLRGQYLSRWKWTEGENKVLYNRLQNLTPAEFEDGLDRLLAGHESHYKPAVAGIIRVCQDKPASPMVDSGPRASEEQHRIALRYCDAVMSGSRPEQKIAALKRLLEERDRIGWKPDMAALWLYTQDRERWERQVQNARETAAAKGGLWVAENCRSGTPPAPAAVEMGGSAAGQEAHLPPARPATAAHASGGNAGNGADLRDSAVPPRVPAIDAEPPVGALDESRDEPEPRKRPGEDVQVDSLPF